MFAHLSRCCLLALVLFSRSLAAAELPKELTAAACVTPPLVDGVLSEGEWQDAEPYKFEMSMVAFDGAPADPRAVELRMMNSANALYVLLQVPDNSIDNSLTPLKLDAATLSFCSGKELVTGDDRKVVAAGIYADKHFVSVGKDADDAHADGLAHMTHADGRYTIEWALQLAGEDKQDLRAAPGDTVRFNLVYFDALQVGFKGTRIGGLFSTDLDHANQYGSVVLASDVKDDGGAAFRGPDWIAERLLASDSPVVRRLKILSSSLVGGKNGPVGKITAEYSYRDPQGKETVGQAKLYLPNTLQQDSTTRLPLYYNAGYELDDGTASVYVARGYAVMTPAALALNPLARTANPDTALLHIARALPFVDDAQVYVSGGSAGGYITLMVAAEAFPLAAAAPDVPPVNWGYNCAYFIKNKPLVLGPDGEGKETTLPVLKVVLPIGDQAVQVFGNDFEHANWFQNSPVAHWETITCPVSVTWTTADMLVPMDQVNRAWVQARDASKFPEGFRMTPEELLEGKEAHTRLADVLPAENMEAFIIKRDANSPAAVELPFSTEKQWSVVVFDEGAPEPQVGHWKYPTAVLREKFMQHHVTGKIASDQLTLAKLSRLMHRHSGKEWRPSELQTLDYPETEQADVVRGLKTYCAAGDEHVRTFQQLYQQLPKELQVLDEATLATLK